MFIEETETKVNLRAQNNPGLSGPEPAAPTLLLPDVKRNSQFAEMIFFPFRLIL